MWVLFFAFGCRELPGDPYRVEEATGFFETWKSSSCVCTWFFYDEVVQAACGDVGRGEVTLYLPFSYGSAHTRIAETATAQIASGGLGSSSFSAGPVIWEYTKSYEDPRESHVWDGHMLRDVIIHELVLPPTSVCPARNDGECIDVPESRLQMALVCENSALNPVNSRSVQPRSPSEPPIAVDLRGAP